MSELLDSLRSDPPRVVLHDDGTCVWLLDVPYPQTFMAWLRQQCHFPGRIHDLACDVVATPQTATLETANQLRHYLETQGASALVLETLQEAELVWDVTYGAADIRDRQSGRPTYYKGADAPGGCTPW